MYILIPFALGALMFFLGLYMVCCPLKSTKEELRNSEDAVKKTKKNGFLVMACGIVVIVAGLIKFM